MHTIVLFKHVIINCCVENSILSSSQEYVLLAEYDPLSIIFTFDLISRFNMFQWIGWLVTVIEKRKGLNEHTIEKNSIVVPGRTWVFLPIPPKRYISMKTGAFTYPTRCGISSKTMAVGIDNIGSKSTIAL